MKEKKDGIPINILKSENVKRKKKKEIPIILAMYVNVKNVEPYMKRDLIQDIHYHLERIIEDYENVISVVIPTETDESRLECVNPILLNEKEFDKIADMVTDFKKALKNKLDEWNDISGYNDFDDDDDHNDY